MRRKPQKSESVPVIVRPPNEPGVVVGDEEERCLSSRRRNKIQGDAPMRGYARKVMTKLFAAVKRTDMDTLYDQLFHRNMQMNEINQGAVDRSTPQRAIGQSEIVTKKLNLAGQVQCLRSRAPRLQVVLPRPHRQSAIHRLYVAPKVNFSARKAMRQGGPSGSAIAKKTGQI